MIRIVLLLAVILGVGCSRGPAEPAERRVSLVVVGSGLIHAAPDAVLPEPLRIQAVDAITGRGARDVQIEWRLVQGIGTLTPNASSTDDDGVASATFRPGGIGTYRIEVHSPRVSGAAPIIEIRAIQPPQLTSVQPATVTAGGEAVLSGTGFSSVAADNVVLIDGLRAAILSASNTELRVRVPLCLPTRTADLTAAVGYARSSAWPLGVTGGQGSALALAPGQSRTLADPGEFGCVRLEGTPGALYLIAAQNVADVHAPPVLFELRGLDATPSIIAAAAPSLTSDFAGEWELALRTRELDMGLEAAGDEDFLAAARPTVVEAGVGDRRDFNVITQTNSFQKITATVRHVSDRALLYVDDEAPANGFSDADLRSLGDLIDGPIWSATVAVFGEPSDIDANQRIIIVFTPRVNALTPRGQSSFVAGYFYGCDLLSRNRCSGTNGGEIFYSIVPDPEARWSDRRTTASVLATVPPVLAHEFQHMIHFAQRGFSADELWLAEALAHTNEEIVAGAITDAALAQSFRAPNYTRAQRYLIDPSRTSLIGHEPPGSLELRGGGWLLLKHLRGHYGDLELLHRLTTTTRSGVDNVTTATGRSWATLLHDFNVAIWADNAPELDGTLQPEQRFVGFNLRSVIGSLPGGYTLSPTPIGWRDFAVSGSVAAASPRHFLAQVPTSGAAPVHFVFSGPFGAPFDPGTGNALTVLRVR